MISAIRAGVLFCISVAAMSAVATTTDAQTIDPHRLYEQRCARCHEPHAGDFVHNNLRRSNGKIVGRKTSSELRAFLDQGHGKLSAQEIRAMVAHLTQIQQSGRLFHDKCIVCHDRAVVFARVRITLKEGRLIGRYTKRDIEQFLKHHGRLDSDEVVHMVGILKRQLITKED